MNKRLSILVALSAALLAACGEDSPAPAAAPPPPAPKAAVEAPPLAAVIPSAADAGVAVAVADPTYSYNPVGKRDPFRSPFTEGNNPNAGEQQPCEEPLCQWNLDRLILVALVTGDANPLAMVEDPTGTGHVLRRGTRIVKQVGKVKSILRESVIVEEPFQTPDGKLQFNPRTLELKKDKNAETPPDLDGEQINVGQVR